MKKLLNGKKVMLIDDDEVDQMLLKFMVEGQGAEFILASNEESALKYMQDQEVDIVLLDTRLPDTNVITFTKKLRERGSSDMNIIGMSSVDMRGRGIYNGLDQVMLRPVEYSKFLKTLYKMLRA